MLAESMLNNWLRNSGNIRAFFPVANATSAQSLVENDFVSSSAAFMGVTSGIGFVASQVPQAAEFGLVPVILDRLSGLSFCVSMVSSI